MKELLDADFHHKEQPSQWWTRLNLFLYWRVYITSFLVAAGILYLLFLRNRAGSDFDAILALAILWLLMLNLFRLASQRLLRGTILSVIIFPIFIMYAPSLVSCLHDKEPYELMHWSWSHFELVSGDISSKSFILVQWVEWFLFYVLLTIITVEISTILKKTTK